MSKRKPRRLRDERADETRSTLLQAAAALFEERGYAGTSLDDVAATARTTKGAVYHHFSDKRALFREVYDALAAKTAERVVREVATRPGRGVPVDRTQLGDAMMKRALRAYLREAAVGSGRRVLFQEGMTVLGGNECRAIDAKHGLGLIQQLVETVGDPALLRAAGSDVISRLLLALIIEAGSIIGGASDPARTTKQVERVMLRALAILRG